MAENEELTTGKLVKTKHSIMTFVERNEKNLMVFATVYYFKDELGEKIDGCAIGWHLPSPGITTLLVVDDQYVQDRILEGGWSILDGTLIDNEYQNYTMRFLDIIKKNRDECVKEANAFVTAIEKAYGTLYYSCLAKGMVIPE